jgi:hypothetical protein
MSVSRTLTSTTSMRNLSYSSDSYKEGVVVGATSMWFGEGTIVGHALFDFLLLLVTTSSFQPANCIDSGYAILNAT